MSEAGGEHDPKMTAQQVLDDHLQYCFDRAGIASLEQMKVDNPNLAYATIMESVWKAVEQTGEPFVDVLNLIIEVTDEDRELLGDLGRDTEVGERSFRMLSYASAHPWFAVDDGRIPPRIPSKDL